MKKRSLILSITTSLLTVSMLAGCESKPATTSTAKEATKTSGVVNVYTERNYDVDKQLYADFEKKTGIKVNLIEGKGDELLERLVREGKDSEADMFITADAGKLHVAKEKGVLQPSLSDTIAKNVPENLRDKDSNWIGLTMRARVIVYAKDRVEPEQLSTYEDLTSDKWKGKVLVRSSSVIYNQSLLASFIDINGEQKTTEWAKGIVANLAREPKGNDRDQAKAVVAGVGDVAIMNTYYVGLLANSSDPEEVKVAEKIGVFFPNQSTSGTHINVSGAGVTKSSKNKENAIKLIEFLSSTEAQKSYASVNYEYPVNKAVEPSELLKSWGEFKTQNINLTKLGENNKKAVEIMNAVGWK
ncbi:Fe(3+) ABC transporter substrate-binding protein [Clostridium magnum]|uniref:Iron uptake protein A1 n=1 Tax=Clostridium magnum DSM 2767 TaxID=1121326 RepID=A0A161WZJ1_9CLOT|nr:Fe(3+) ABC transporter substrate-binding protein [Clostridium magnum]KZL92578.1 iron uptake protein A1 precursor [Clostridium magnum DSM 2767]SHJ05396.1 iron(III) transport system substrate-binding protein [Clostridium magnum DSM 2767]